MGSIVSSISGALGGGSGLTPNLQTPATTAQATEQYGNVQNSIKQQQDFVNALQAQNGIQNQSNVFNQLQGVANGTGPNPAQAMLANATGNNAANQAAMMAGQRGSGANAGLIARQAAQQGGALQQQAAGQGAALQAQQSLGALNQLGGIAGQQVGQQAGANQALSQSSQGAQQNVLGAINQQNQLQQQLAMEKAKQQGGLMSALAAGAGTALMGPLGGMMGGMFGGGGGNAVSQIGGAGGLLPGMMDNLGNAVNPEIDYSNLGGGGNAAGNWMTGNKMAEGGPVSTAAQYFHRGGPVPAMVSPGEKYLSPSDVNKVEHGASPMKQGETIPGKPKVGGSKNDYSNDTVKKDLQEGGVILPRSVTKSKNPDKAAEAFVGAILARKGKGLKK